MLKRLLFGLLKGSLIGGLLAYSLVAGLSVTSLTGAWAYAAVVLAGVATALIAGRPIWAAEARVEVLLKSVAAALLGSGFLFVVNRYFSVRMDLGPLGSGALVQLPYVLLPTVSTLLAVFFEVDNDDSAAQQTGETGGFNNQRVRVEGRDVTDTGDEDEADEPVTRAGRR